MTTTDGHESTSGVQRVITPFRGLLFVVAPDATTSRQQELFKN